MLGELQDALLGTLPYGHFLVASLLIATGIRLWWEGRRARERKP